MKNTRCTFLKKTKLALLVMLSVSSYSALASDLSIPALGSNTESEAIQESDIINNAVTHFNFDRIKNQSRFTNLARANLNLGGDCGNFDPAASVSEAFSGGNIQAMFDGVIKNVKSAAMGFAGRVLQEANPGMYEFLQKGVDLGFSDYLGAFQSCDGVQNLMLDNTPSSLIKKASIGDQLLDKAKPNTSVDITSFIKSPSLRDGSKGIKGVDGHRYGGNGADALRVVSQTVKAGWCMLSGTSGGQCTGITSSGQGSSNEPVIEKMFPTAADAERWAVNLLGEVSLRTCENCEAVKSTPPQSIAQLIDQEQAASYGQLETLVNDLRLDQIRVKDLKNVSTSTYPISRSLIGNLKQEKLATRDALTQQIAGELATAKVLDHVVMLRQILVAGRTNSKLLNNEAVQKEASERIKFLDQSVTNYTKELALRKMSTTKARKLTNDRAIARSVNEN
ncbi:hypothetical protein [Photobacterium leiognathi]|uniref:hypothetical protein n=1 Tax=Photobacterium leiognathi TaxID=553611 RepID=UPI0029829B1A|nr:hypothetical protein [Photobacterium leiognathi]